MEERCQEVRSSKLLLSGIIGIGALSDIAILSYSSDGWFFELHVIFKALLNGLSEIDDIRNW